MKFIKNIGLIGFGRIGKRVSNSKSFNANLKVYEKSKFHKSKKLNFVSLKRILNTSEIISIHIPLNKEKKNF